MGILELKFEDKTYTSPNKINEILRNNGFYWLIDSEVIDAEIEIVNNTIVWHNGFYMTGDWQYGIFKNGFFYGNFKNGIFEDGLFKGNWESGINLKNN